MHTCANHTNPTIVKNRRSRTSTPGLHREHPQVFTHTHTIDQKMAASCHDVDPVPGNPTETGTSLLETATGAIQGFAPISQIHQHLCAFHFYGDDMTRQVEAHHFCAHLSEDMRQCLIFDGPEAGARLIGLEYIVTEELFLTLPDDEKPLWHSHEFEVKGGVLFMPGVPGVVERRDLEKVAKTYGKTIHFWQVDRGDALPLGLPQIMMALTRDGQLRQDLAECVEKKFGVSFQKEKENRAYMSGPAHGIHPLANAAGKGLKTGIREVDLKDAGTRPRVFT
uniref:Uncharacterized protein n=1 Tax=Avena sativa TaxID=4498 RepID=A0ACD5VA34_AVESA